MMRFLLLLLLASCANDTVLSRVCPETCYTFKRGIPGEGICKEGVPLFSNGATCEMAECVGEVGPENEICNGIDDNCNAGIDEYTFQLQNPCPLKFGVCGQNATWECKGSAGWVCDYGETYEQEETTCDGLDNDCDGGTDEALPLELCYTGDPPESVLHSPCRAGILRCDGVSTYCDDVTPVPEVLDCIDNDCDGIIDEGFDESIDVVYAIDDSGSMSSFLGTSVYGIKDFHLAYDDPSMRFALVGFSGGVEHMPLVHVKLDFSPLAEFVEALDALGVEPTGSEASLDALHDVCKNTLNLSFRSNSQRLFVGVTDEPPQTYALPSVSSQDAATACSEAGVKVHFFANDYAGFHPICDQTGGKMYILSTNHQDILASLSDIFTTSCN